MPKPAPMPTISAPDCGDPMPLVGRPEGSPPPADMPVYPVHEDDQ